MSMQTIDGVIHGKIIELSDDPGLPDGNQVQVVVWPIRLPTAGHAEAASPLPGPPPGWRPGCTETAAGMLAEIWSEEDDRILAQIEQDRRSAVGREVPE
jgi:hypothetical protein